MYVAVEIWSSAMETVTSRKLIAFVEKSHVKLIQVLKEVEESGQMRKLSSIFLNQQIGW